MTRRNAPDDMTDAGAAIVAKAASGSGGKNGKVPGPSPNSATNLIIADVGFRALSVLFRQTMEKGLLRARFSPGKAREIVQGKTMAHSLASYTIAKVATRSIPGFLLVTTRSGRQGIVRSRSFPQRGLATGRRDAGERGRKFARRLNRRVGPETAALGFGRAACGNSDYARFANHCRYPPRWGLMSSFLLLGCGQPRLAQMLGREIWHVVRHPRRASGN